MKCPVCKKNISQTALKCPYCKTRTGLLCSHCNSVNPIGSVVCNQCGSELLKICSNCNSVNFPSAVKCRKCGSPFGKIVQNKSKVKKDANKVDSGDLKYKPKLYTIKQAVETLSDGILSTDRKIFSICAEKGSGKSSVLKLVIKKLESKKLQWCIGKCTPITQITPGGVVKDMLLNLFRLPNYGYDCESLGKDAFDFFSKEFSFLNSSEVSDFLNFVYSSKDGDYEDIIVNKKRTYGILHRIFEAFCQTGRFVFVVDNFDFIDGFSAEFLTEFIRHEKNWKYLKFIAICNDYRPISGFFGFEDKSLKAYEDINLCPLNMKELEKTVNINSADYISDREKELIFSKCSGNYAYLEQAFGYAFDCQINDVTFILPDSFSSLVKARLEILKKTNEDAHKLLCASAILGDKLNISLLREIFSKEIKNFQDTISYLQKSNFIRPYDDLYYEFNNLYLWENIVNNIKRDSVFEDINVKVGKAINVFSLNITPTMSIIAHNLKETRMAFDIWTKTARLSCYIGDINLYVIAQKQCIALLNEFNDNETLEIRYSISEKLGKLLSEYDPEEAMEYLPDAISHAKENKDEVKEIELLAYLTQCCQKTGNYYGNVECSDNILKKLSTDGQSLEKAMVLTSKLSSLVDIGNCGEVISLIDNDILPVLNSYLAKPKLNKLFPLGILFDTWLKVYLILAKALALQGNNRVFEVLKNLYTIAEKHRINDKSLVAGSKLVEAYAYTMKGNFSVSDKILAEIKSNFNDYIDYNLISRQNLVIIINRFMQKKYEDIRQELFDAVTFANNTGDNFTKNILKTMLGKIFKDENHVKHALDIYNEQITYFAKEKMALGALLSWYLISEATLVTENSKSAIDISERALEIAQNPDINNYFFIVILRLVLAKSYLNIADFQTAKIHLETALKIASKYEMYDLLSRLYLLYGSYYYEMGIIKSPQQAEYLRGCAMMYERAMETIVKYTNNLSVKNDLINKKEKLNDFCSQNGIKL